MVLVPHFNLELHQTNVKIVFGMVISRRGEAYMTQIGVKGKENLVCRLKKLIYGLKQDSCQ